MIFRSQNWSFLDFGKMKVGTFLFNNLGKMTYKKVCTYISKYQSGSLQDLALTPGLVEFLHITLKNLKLTNLENS